jgi:hypothetical protein
VSGDTMKSLTAIRKPYIVTTLMLRRFINREESHSWPEGTTRLGGSSPVGMVESISLLVTAFPEGSSTAEITGLL